MGYFNLISTTSSEITSLQYKQKFVTVSHTFRQSTQRTGRIPLNAKTKTKRNVKLEKKNSPTAAASKMPRQFTESGKAMTVQHIRPSISRYG